MATAFPVNRTSGLVAQDKSCYHEGGWLTPAGDTSDEPTQRQRIPVWIDA